ncbi:MAG: hypothetical protein HQ557_05670 [Bacteroidetes bacterium]|nr:hypothetical protein [Bacteroidota bacterium]
MKAANAWQKRFNRGLKRIQIELSPGKVKCYGIYRGQRPANFDNINILSAAYFLKKLWDGNSIS